MSIVLPRRTEAASLGKSLNVNDDFAGGKRAKKAVENEILN